MNQVIIISDVIKWIEKNLESPMSIDLVAKKSGYSKWYLQRMFKKVTGCILGDYIRHRRLTYAALVLKLTSKPILDIAMQYRFNSQQTFTRSFKKQFTMTPASYRRSELWDTSGLRSAIELYKVPLLVAMPKIMDVGEQVFWGVSYKSCRNLDELLNEKQAFHWDFFSDYFKKYIKSKENFPHQIFSFCQPKPNLDNPGEQEIVYTMVLKEQKNIEGMTQFILQPCRYAVFKYIGPVATFWDFITQIYLEMLPKLGMKRQKGPIIEIFRHCDTYDFSHGIFQVPDEIECDYCVPVETKNDVVSELERIEANLS